MKKIRTKAFVISAIVILLVTTVVMANSGLITQTEIADTTVANFEPEFDRLAKYMGYNSEEKFDSFHKTAIFMGKYCADEESFSFIEEMILSGCDAETTMDIYQFYLTTNEPITIVKQIYDMVWTGEAIENRDAVFESAFNELTDNKCGVLTEEDIVSYLERGLTVDDISHANLLCRKGVLTIQQILEKVLEGTSWEEIEKTVLAEDTKPQISSEQLSQRTKNTNEKLKEKGFWKGRKGKNFDKIAEVAEKKGVSKEKLEQLMDKGYSELDIVNALHSEECTPLTVEEVVKKETDRK